MVATTAASKMLALATVTALASTSAAVDPVKGTITLYEHRDFGGQSATINVNSFGCILVPGKLAKRASSANWTGLRVPGVHIQIIFYASNDCDSYRHEYRGWKVDDFTQPPSNFDRDGINDMVSSVQVQEW